MHETVDGTKRTLVDLLHDVRFEGRNRHFGEGSPRGSSAMASNGWATTGVMSRSSILRAASGTKRTPGCFGLSAFSREADDVADAHVR